MLFRSPWPVLIVGAGVLLALAIPAFNVVLGQVDDRVLPRDNPAAVANATIRAQFPGEEGTPHEIVLRDAKADQVDAYATRISEIPGVERVQTPTSIIHGGAVVGPNPAGATMTAGDLTRVTAVGSRSLASGEAAYPTYPLRLSDSGRPVVRVHRLRQFCLIPVGRDGGSGGQVVRGGHLVEPLRRAQLLGRPEERHRLSGAGPSAAEIGRAHV